MKVEGLLEKLEEMMEKIEGKENRMPNIAEVSLAIEHRKFELSNIFESIKDGKRKYLKLLNMLLVDSLNSYNFILMVLGKDEDPEELIKELESASQSQRKCLLELIEDCK